VAGTGHLDPRVLQQSAVRAGGPFQPDHLATVLAANIVGAALIFAGWWAASGTSSARSQLAWLNLTLVGLIVAAAANGLWLARGRRTVMLARGSVLPYPPRRAASPRAASSNGHGPVGRIAASGHEGFVAASNMTRYHSAGCGLVTGKQVMVAPRAAHESAGRIACEVCRP
jgi:hypothetical protein